MPAACVPPENCAPFAAAAAAVAAVAGAVPVPVTVTVTVTVTVAVAAAVHYIERSTTIGTWLVDSISVPNDASRSPSTAATAIDSRREGATT